MLKISSSGTSNAGKRNINEDNFYMNGIFIAESNAASGRVYSDSTHSGTHFYAVFDGLGEDIKSGINPNLNFYEGGTASFAAADMLSRLQRHLKTKEQYNLNEYIYRFVKKTNKNICDYINQKGGYKIGASFAVLCFDGSSAYAYNIGNTKIFLLRDNRLSLISQNDTKAESMAMAKQISADIARYTSDNKILTQYLGIAENEKPLDLHINRVHIRSGDKFLICSDALCEYLTADRIFQTLSRDISEQEIVTELVNESMRREGTENITLIAVGVNYSDETSNKANLLKPTSDMPVHFTPITFRNKFTFKPKHIQYILYIAGALVLFIVVIVMLFNGPLKSPDNGEETTGSETDGLSQGITDPPDNPGNTGNMVVTTDRYTFDIPTIDLNAPEEETTTEEETAQSTTAAPTTVVPAVQNTTAPPVQTTTVPPPAVTNPPETTVPVDEPTMVDEIITEPTTEAETELPAETEPTEPTEIETTETESETEPAATEEPVTEPPTEIVTEELTEEVTEPETVPETQPPQTEEQTIAAE